MPHGATMIRSSHRRLRRFRGFPAEQRCKCGVVSNARIGAMRRTALLQRRQTGFHVKPFSRWCCHHSGRRRSRKVSESASKQDIEVINLNRRSRVLWWKEPVLNDSGASQRGGMKPRIFNCPSLVMFVCSDNDGYRQTNKKEELKD